MQIEEGVTRDEFLKRVLPSIAYIQESVLFWIGDALVEAEDNRKWGEMYQDSKELSKYNYGTRRNAKWVCSQLQLSRRRDNLSWGHHQEIAAIRDIEQQDFWLKKASEDNLTIRALREGIRQSRPGAEPNRVPTPALIGYGEIKNIEDLTSWIEKEDLEKWTPDRCEAVADHLTPIVEFHKKLLDRTKAVTA